MTLPPQERILRQTSNWTQHLVPQPAISAAASSDRAAHTPIKANRVIALLSKKPRVRYAEQARRRSVRIRQAEPRDQAQAVPEARRAGAPHDALDAHPDVQAADIVRMLLLTGARSGEVFAMRWDQLNLESGKWVKPGATTKQKTEHEVPLSPDVVQLFVGPTRGGRRWRCVRVPWSPRCRPPNRPQAAVARDLEGCGHHRLANRRPAAQLRLVPRVGRTWPPGHRCLVGSHPGVHDAPLRPPARPADAPSHGAGRGDGETRWQARRESG